MLRPFALLAIAGFSTVACAASLDEAGAQAQDDTATGTVSAANNAAAGRRVCSWNVRRLGNKFDGKAKDMDLVQKVITANCDLIAVQEVMQTTGGGAAGFDALATALGPLWGALRTDESRPNKTSSNSERYAWFWRKSAVSQCDGFTDARYVPDTTGMFLRDPAYACFKMNAHAKELVLATYHALYGSEVERKREVALLDDDLDQDGTTDDIFRSFRAARPGADVFMMGDFNLTTSQLKIALPTYKDLSAGKGSTLSADGNVSSNEYDHVLMMPDEALAADVAPALTLDVRSVATDAPTYFQTVSDHLPIQLTLPN